MKAYLTIPPDAACQEFEGGTPITTIALVINPELILRMPGVSIEDALAYVLARALLCNARDAVVECERPTYKPNLFGLAFSLDSINGTGRYLTVMRGGVQGATVPPGYAPEPDALTAHLDPAAGTFTLGPLRLTVRQWLTGRPEFSLHTKTQERGADDRDGYPNHRAALAALATVACRDGGRITHDRIKAMSSCLVAAGALESESSHRGRPFAMVADECYHRFIRRGILRPPAWQPETDGVAEAGIDAPAVLATAPDWIRRLDVDLARFSDDALQRAAYLVLEPEVFTADYSPALRQAIAEKREAMTGHERAQVQTIVDSVHAIRQDVLATGASGPAA